MTAKRFIPTAVGNASRRGGIRRRIPVHPHGCGERSAPRLAIRPKCGSSPRLWGTPVKALLDLGNKRFIPTAVGNACV